MKSQYYCLNKDEINNLLLLLYDFAKIDDENLKIRIDNARNWYESLGSINYLLSLVLEKRVHNKEVCDTIINFCYDLQDKMFFIIHEMDINFIDYMIKSPIFPEMSLEENLINLYYKYQENRF